MKFNLQREEIAFLLVLACEEEMIEKRMKEIAFPIDQLDLEALRKKLIVMGQPREAMTIRDLCQRKGNSNAKSISKTHPRG